MKLKSSFYFSLFFFSCLFTNAQSVDDSQEIYKWEFGLNVSALADRFISLDDNTRFEPYLITLKKRIENNMWLRTGYNISMSSNNSDRGSGNPSSSSFFLSGRVRLGLEKQYLLTKNFLLTSGVDFTTNYFYRNNVSNSNFEELKQISNSYSVGIGPVVGIHWQFKERFRLGTEASLSFNFFQNSNRTESSINPDNDRIDYGFNMAVQSPVSLFFAILI